MRKGLLVAFCLLPLLLSLLGAQSRSEPESWTVLLSGDADGYLAPCGCTSPQQGGMKRRATALRGGGEHTVRLDNGGLSGGIDRQRVLKAETAARALGVSKIDAANFTGSDARLGENEALQLDRLSGGRLLSTSLQPSPTVLFKPWRQAGPFLVGGATTRPDLLGRGLRESALRPMEAAHRLVEEAIGQGLAPVLLFDGSREAAAVLARAEPALRLVTYRATGAPPRALEREGACALATPGERGKGIVRLTWRDGAFVSSTVETLGPEFPDDPDAKALYTGYLKDVAREGLLDKAPHERHPERFTGSAACATCHAAAGKVWAASGHAHALKTLERVGNHRDPDCVPCHVVGASHEGLEPTMAFWSRARTPRLADVGCESCHGAGAAHAASPWKVALPKAGPRSCKPCHTLENSPNFEFGKYWARIKHGSPGR